MVLFFVIVILGILFRASITVICGFAICLPIIIIHILLYFRTEYVLTPDELVIKSPGSRDEHIRLIDITSAKKVKSDISAKVLSTERIRIKTDGKVVYIPPVDRDAFIEKLYARRADSESRSDRP